MSVLQVQVAVYGALCGGPDQMHARDVTAQLQAALNSKTNNGVVNINNDSMGGDPCSGKTKAFGAVVTLDGTPLFFACLEGQTVDFFHSTTGLVAEKAEGAKG
ncbi:MAG TPA: hypothetical protein VGD38_15205 [Pyrinomonadaceae bacterium]